MSMEDASSSLSQISQGAGEIFIHISLKNKIIVVLAKEGTSGSAMCPTLGEVHKTSISAG